VSYSPDFFALQTVLYERLKASPDVAALATGVFDYVPEVTSYPYVSFDTLTGTRDTFVDLSTRFLCQQVIRVYSNDADVAKGFQQVRDLATVIYALFDAAVIYAGQRRMQTFVQNLSISRGEGTVRLAALTVQILFP
jgi:hypothetical protein